ncbi:MAG: 25S rRNA (adenine645-N1)-methyltransferase [Lichina confinis]|nr:MAG: 25S rRNA (adenine645-N1)-methyltransferase [Lichina confinis]
MFAVPGWSISASDLKQQTAEDGATRSSKSGSSALEGENGAIAQSDAGPKKRRRPPKTGNVNAENLEELWKKFIDRADGQAAGAKGEIRPDDGEKRRERKRKPRREKKKDSEARVEQGNQGDEEPAVDASLQISKKRGRQRQSDNLGRDSTTAPDRQAPGGSTSVQKQGSEGQSLDPTSARPAPTVELTPLQASMRQKLVSARFRHLNESLYRTTSSDSFEKFQQNPELFGEYHEGFRQQVASWPENPVDSYIRELEQRGRAGLRTNRAERKMKGRRNDSKAGNSDLDGRGAGGLEGSDFRRPLPRNKHGMCSVVDLGCGDARLARAMEPLGKDLKLAVRSFDLQKSAGDPNISRFVTQADISKLPMTTGTADVAIFCLSLMGTNWIDFVEEAYRVLRWNGELWVAEIKSRLVNPASSAIAARPAGAKKARKKSQRTRAGADEDDDDGAELPIEAVLEDENDDSVRGTAREKAGLAPFIEVLRKRGFALISTPSPSSSSSSSSSTPHDSSSVKAIDLSNKMFVKMEFIKALKPSKGRFSTTATAADDDNDVAKPGTNTDRFSKPKTKKRRFLDNEDQDDASGAAADDTSLEAAVLKPCLYKIR